MPLDYKTWHTVLDDEHHRLRVRLQRAGHILGSAYVEVESLDKVQGQLQSTYGDRRHRQGKLKATPRSCSMSWKG
ncbi:hypothetical protein [Halomonas koreensis]|uniref:hypothetical protein n=1 Tax=Halomonas koreensis TaxID=245385 RepID=UPI00286BF3D3|nr:hypothetical protein [Halomonas koreensis]